MALAKECDRCGKYYKGNHHHYDLFQASVHVGFQYIWDDGSSGLVVDLCDECQAALESFMKMEGGEDEKA